MHFRSRSLIAVAAAVGLLVAGCGTEETGTPAPQNSGSAESAVAGAGTESAATGSAATGNPVTESAATESAATESAATESAATESAATESAATGSAATDGGTGTSVDPAGFAVDLEAGMTTVTSLTATLDAGMGGQSGAGKVSQTLDNGALVSADMTVGVAGQEMRVRIVDGEFYFGGPLLSQVVPEAAGKEWILVDENSSNPQISTVATTLAPIISNAGTDSYVFMARAITEVTDEGAETIGSFETTKYRTVIDVQKAAEVLPESMKPYGQLLKASGMTEMETYYWLDAENRMVQSAVTAEAGGQAQTTTLTVQSFNEPLEITAPDPATVYSG